MTFTMPKWLVHLLVYVATAAGAIATFAATVPKTNVPAGWLPAIAGAAGLIATGLHQVLGMFKPAAATVTLPPGMITYTASNAATTMAPEPAAPTPPAGP